MSVTHCDECGLPWMHHGTVCVRTFETPRHPLSGSSGALYEFGFSACLAHIAAQPAIAMHCTKQGEPDQLDWLTHRVWREQHGWTCVPMIYQPTVIPDSSPRAVRKGAA